MGMRKGPVASLCTCRPTTQFCCGCSLRCGANFILVCNLMINVFYISTAVANIILRVPTVGFSSDMTHQVVNSAFCLFGLPFIIAALYGVAYRQEPHIRLYLYYLVLSFVIDLAYVVYYMFVEDACGQMNSYTNSQGSAFACGMTRLVAFICIGLLAIIQGYCIFVLWSVAEDIRATGTGAGFPELLESHQRNMQAKGAYGGQADGIFGTYAGPAVAARSSNYGSLSAPTMGGGNGFFGGSRHEVNYPPRGDTA